LTKKSHFKKLLTSDIIKKLKEVYVKKLILISTILIVVAMLNAAWIDNMPSQLTQPDGTVIDVLLSGDEFHNWPHDENGFTIIPDFDTGYYCWAIPAPLLSGDVVSSGYPIHLHTPQSLGLQPRLNISEELYIERRAEHDHEFEMNNRSGMRAPTIGTVNNIVIFIRFADQSEFTWTPEFMNNIFNGTAENTNSFHRYFYDASYQQLNVWGHFFPVPGFTLLSYQSPNPRSFYANSTTNRRNLLLRAVNHIAPQVPPTLVIDSDNDGVIDNLIFMIRGESGAWASSLWSHMSTLSGATINGKSTGRYNFNMEDYFNIPSAGGVALLVHEFGHTLGAPDFYRYNNNGTPMDVWEVMSSQTNPPQSMSAHVKWKYMGWIPEIPLIDSSGVYTLSPNTVSQTNHAYRILSPYSQSEYFVVEYRSTSTGVIDSTLPGSGLLVYRIVPTIRGNAQGPPDEIYTYRPGGTSPGVYGNVRNAFYSAQSGRTAINDTTSPRPFLSSGLPGGLNITNIGMAENTISFFATIPEHTILSIPYTEDFNSGTNLSSIGWSGNLSANSGVRAGSGVGGTNGLTLNVRSSNSTQSAISPRIGPTTANTNLTFAYRIVNWTTNWSGALTPTTLSANDKVFIEISTTGPLGIFTTIREVNNTNHTTTTSFVNINQSLSSFAGQNNVVVRFRSVRATGDWVLVVDDVSFNNIDAPDISINPPNHFFGDVYIGSAPTIQTFTITNTGSMDLSIEEITISGIDQDQYSLSEIVGLPWTMEPGDTQHFDVSFSPTSIGVKLASISIVHNAIGTPSVVELSGTGDISTPGLFFTLINDGTAYEVSRGTADSEHIVISTIHNLLPVTRIADEGFSLFSTMTSIHIPDSVTIIGSTAFYGCTGLTEISIPSSVIMLEDNPFVSIPNLEYIYVDAYNTHFRSEGNSLIRNSDNTLITGTMNSLIPDSVTTIGEQAFYGCARLTHISIPNSVHSIGTRAFENCTNLAYIVISNSVSSIDNFAFRLCPNLTIYAEAPSKPDGWALYWNLNNRPVVWGYTPILSIPLNLQIEDTKLIWDLVQNAVSYEIDIDGDIYESVLNSFDLESLINPKVYNLKVRAIGNDYLFFDSEWSETIEYAVVSDSDIVSIVQQARLVANFPNPFNPETTIQFEIFSVESLVKIDVYNIRGQLVKSLVDGSFSAGSHSIVWDGTDESGVNMASGIYFYRMATDGYTSVRRMLLLK
jgi:M6 family metalloprotease-like protein